MEMFEGPPDLYMDASRDGDRPHFQLSQCATECPYQATTTKSAQQTPYNKSAQRSRLERPTNVPAGTPVMSAPLAQATAREVEQA